MSAASDPALADGVAIPDCAAVLELLGAYLATDLGRAELARLRFHRDPFELERRHRLWSEARVWIAQRGGFGFSGLEDPRPLLPRARAAGLDGGELLELAAFLEAIAALRASLLSRGSRRLFRGQSRRERQRNSEGRPAPCKRKGATPTRRSPGLGPRGPQAGASISGARGEAALGPAPVIDSGEDSAAWPLLAELASALPDLAGLARALRSALLPSGELSDDASPALSGLRRHRARQRQAIESSLAQHLRRLGGEGVLQDELITLRNERFVLPVRAELRRRAPGVVHGASSSGQTVFVEPLETIELNNEHIRLLDQEQAEIRRILAELSGRVAVAAPEIAQAAEICGEIELESAKARFAADYRAQPAEFGEELELAQARHPLLVASLRSEPGREAVPMSLRLAPERMLVVSGPNTGGKTVVLKTVGMAAWMAQCGLPVCAQRARLPVFDALWADMGDVQSIERSLSTFSSHLVHIRGILVAASAESLVLFDELGTATNAAEGAALAVEIAEFLRRRHAWTLISTHHDALKAWAGQHGGEVANGSVAVDPETLAPSYHFRLGVPGASAGLDMAQRLGLPAEIVAGARGRLSAGEREATEYLRSLQQNLARAEEQLAALAEREQVVARRERELAAHDRAYQQKQMAALRADLERRLAAYTAAADQAWRRELGELKATLTAAQQRKLAVAQARHKREAAEALASMLPAADEPAPTPVPQPQPQPGDQVRLRSLRAPARILRALDGGGFEVEAGALRMQVSAGDIVAVVPPAAPAKTVEYTAPAAVEINLIGLRAEEALDQLDKFLDRALLAEADQVRIVHGAGFGVLRKAVADALRAYPHIARYFHPPQNQGGQGVTLAELK